MLCLGTLVVGVAGSGNGEDSEGVEGPRQADAALQDIVIARWR